MHHAYLQYRLSYSDIELKAIQLMNEPMELEVPAMFAYIPFPEEWFTEVGLYHEQVKELETITLAVDEHVFAVKKAGAIAAKRMITATNKTQNNMECSPDETRQHYDLAKAAILAELLRWTSKNQALRRQKRKDAVNLLTSRYVFTWKRASDGSRRMQCRLTAHGFKDTAASDLEGFSGTSTRWGQCAVVAVAVHTPMANGFIGCL